MSSNLRRAYIYLAASGPGVVSAVHVNSAGIYYEQEEPIHLSDWRDPASLAPAVRRCLERFSFRDADLRNATKADWPAYRASGCRSVREFESHYVPIGAVALNEADLLYDAHVQPAGEDEITLHHCCPKQERVVNSAIETEDFGG